MKNLSIKNSVRATRCAAILPGLALALSLGTSAASDDVWVKEVPLANRQLWSGKADIKTLPKGGPAGEDVIQWTTPASTEAETSVLLEALDINPNDFDEIACEFFLDDSDAYLNWNIREFPVAGQVSEWYSKAERPLRRWIPWSCDLRLDDQGVYLWVIGGYPGKTPQPKSPELVLRLTPFFLSVPGEPEIRRVRIANLRFVKYPVRITYDKTTAVTRFDEEAVTVRYKVTLKNEQKIADECRLTLDSSKLHYFKATVNGKPGDEHVFEMKPSESREIEVGFSMPRSQANKLPGLYSEPLDLSAKMGRIPEVTVRPLRSECFDSLWATVPIFHPTYPSARQTAANIKVQEKIFPWVTGFMAAAVKKAEGLLDYVPEIPKELAWVHQNAYLTRFGERPIPLSLTEHKCQKTGEIYSSEWINAAYRPHAHMKNFKAANDLATAYQLTGDERFAVKAIAILAEYGRVFRDIPTLPKRSTCANGTLGQATLLECFIIPDAISAYEKVISSPSLTADDRRRIQEDFLYVSASRLSQHNANANQQAEHFSIIIPAAVMSGHWPLAGERIYGPLGWFNLVQVGFSSDGIAHEGGGYHAGQMGSVGAVAEFLLAQRINLYTASLKRVFDGSVASSPTGVSRFCPWLFEAAYAQYGDPAYLPTLASWRKTPNMATLTWGVPGLPDDVSNLRESSNLTGDGYFFLRGGGSLCLAINYGKQWERSEKDRLHFRLFQDGKPLSRALGRITYGSPWSENMYRTFAHNVVTVDRGDALDVRLNDKEIPPVEGFHGLVLSTKPGSELYPGVRQSRIIAIVGSSFFVADVLTSDSPRTFDWHFFPDAPAQKIALPLADLTKEPELIKGGVVAGSLGKCRDGQSDGGFTVDFADAAGKPTLTAQILANGPLKVLDGSIMQFSTPKLHPFLRATRTDAREGVFGALFTPAGAPPAKLTSPAAPKGLILWEITEGASRWLIGWNSTNSPIKCGSQECGPGASAQKY